MIVASESHDSAIKSIVLRLGGLHLEMSFLGSIGHLMASSGLQEILERVFAKSAVLHMLSGKAIARAVRGHFLVDRALNALLVRDTFNIPLAVTPDERSHVPLPDGISDDVPLPDESSDVPLPDGSSHVPLRDGSSDNVPLPDESYHIPLLDESSHVPLPDDIPTQEAQRESSIELQAAAEMYQNLIDESITPNDVCQSEIIQKITEKLEEKKRALANNRTAVLWLEYMKMVDVLRTFIKAERMGNWNLHLQAVYEMLPYFAASGHNQYAKSAHIYLQQMQDLKNSHPSVYRCFQDGLHVIRRSDRLWAGLSTDLAIEQVLMRSIKTTGGLTRGRGMTEIQRLVWLMSMPSCAEVNDAMQECTGVNYLTSEQHKDTTKARIIRDFKDEQEIISFLSQNNPFSKDTSLRSIASGVLAEAKVNVDKTKEVGDHIIKSLKGKDVIEHSFKKNDQAVTLASKTAVKISKTESIQIDPGLLFQRLSVVATGGQYDNPSSFFEFEMCSFPPALFDASLLPRKANKSVLADEIWSYTNNDSVIMIPKEIAYFVLDAGALVHRIPWPPNLSYAEICSMYVQYLKRRYKRATIVFDGYEAGPSTKDCTHQRRSSVSGPLVTFQPEMILKLKKDEFLSNPSNKQQFIYLLGEALRRSGYVVIHTPGDADVSIVQTAIHTSRLETTVLVGDDTDLLILLCYHAESTLNDIFFMPEPRQRSKTRRIWNIKQTRSSLGLNLCNSLLFAHAILGCDTTSSVFGIGKQANPFKSYLQYSTVKNPQRILSLSRERRPLCPSTMEIPTKASIP